MRLGHKTLFILRIVTITQLIYQYRNKSKLIKRLRDSTYENRIS
ncbi:hypothetical protein FDUTEX481_02846 [Tolypothrix sp. PCC 7601]|nr:hypothetical protein FDUTEX481_02846 [Tolypothrix sp. PCC 7601]